MKFLLAIAMSTFLCICSASASDKDVLRDACGALKSASKKSQCFDALERLTSTTPAQSPAKQIDPPKLNTINFRALSCERFDFNELDSLGRFDLAAAVCSFDAGDRMSSETTDASMAKQSDPRIKAALLKRQIDKSSQCHSEQTKALDLYRRKFNELPDCSRMPGKFAPPAKGIATAPVDVTPSSAN